MATNIQYVNPEGLSKNPAYSQAVVTSGTGKTIYIGGKNSLNAKGEITGKGNLAQQTTQAMHNLEIALKAAGGDWNNIIKMGIYVMQGQDFREGYTAAQPFLQKMANPPIVTAMMVAGLANPDFLVEIEAIAFVSEP